MWPASSIARRSPRERRGESPGRRCPRRQSAQGLRLMQTRLSIVELTDLTHRQTGIVDVPCPLCGPGRISPSNRDRKVLRIWKQAGKSAGYHCVRCGARGRMQEAGLSTASSAPTNASTLASVSTAESRARRARHLWHLGIPVEGPVEQYLRNTRAFGGLIPATIRQLPAQGVHGPAMVAAFGLAGEQEPSVVSIASSRVRAIHITRLKADGSGKDGANAKLMIGPVKGSPIVLSHPNDSLGLAVVEGIESGLSLVEATGLGVWVAGSAGMMPALAERVPHWIDCVSIVADPDPAGRDGAAGLAAGLKERGLHVEIRVLQEVRS